MFLFRRLLEKSLSEIPTQYAISAWSVDAPIGTKIAQDFLIDNFDKVYKRFNEMDSFMFAGVLNGAFGFITTNDELNRVSYITRYCVRLNYISAEEYSPVTEVLICL